MSAVLLFNLIAHIIFGILGVILFGIVWLKLSDEKLSIRALRNFSLAGLISFLISWLTGGYYYVVHYGKAVKPIILASEFPWAHSAVMETKEHVFLLLPFLSAIAYLALRLLGRELETKPVLKSSLTRLIGLIVVLGALVTIFGFIVSGAKG